MNADVDKAGPPLPRANPLLIGQAAAEARLLEAFRSGRLPHAWLISGPRGVGKATLAYRFARYVLGQGPGGHGLDGQALDDQALGGQGLFGADPPGPAEGLAMPEDSAAFRLIASASHPDLRVLDRGQDESGKPQQSISVEKVRSALGFVHLTPALGGWRLILVDAADDLNRNAANALLKALEEPPRNTLLLLLAHAPGRLLPTIRSRCCHLVLPPLPTDEVTRLLARYAPELSAQEAAGLAHLAEGSVGRALDLASEGGLGLYAELVTLLSGLPGIDFAKLQALAERLGRDRSGAAFRTASDLLLWWLARLARAAALNAPPEEIVAGEGALISRLLAQGNLAQAASLWEKLHRLFGRAEAVNLDRRQVFMAAFQELEALSA